MRNPTMLFGFSETRTVPLGELGGTLHQYTHEKTGARLCWIERAEENKTFAIAFAPFPPTIPAYSISWNTRCSAVRRSTR